MAKLTYAQKLTDPRWAEKRKQIIERDRGRCKICRGRDDLQVHHLGYISGASPWQVPDEYLVTLCDTCHDREERFKKLVSEEVKAIAVSGIPHEAIYNHLLILKNAPSNG